MNFLKTKIRNICGEAIWKNQRSILRQHIETAITEMIEMQMRYECEIYFCKKSRIDSGFDSTFDNHSDGICKQWICDNNLIVNLNENVLHVRPTKQPALHFEVLVL